MKKTALMNGELSHLVATIGHTDEYTICDAGLPVPTNVQRIDLALTHGIPAFTDVVKTLLSESQIEGVIMAEEFPEVSPQLHAQVMELLHAEEQRCGKSFAISYVSHEAFKLRTHHSRAIVRTGECTGYANVIFQAGVVF